MQRPAGFFCKKKATAAGAAAVGREFERHQSQLIAAPRPRAAYAYLALLGIIAQRASAASAGWRLEAGAATTAHTAMLTERPLRGGDATVAPRAG